MKYFETSIDIRFDETDEMGIVHHKHFFSWFEISRFQILKSAGLDYQELKSEHYGFVVVNAQCEYLIPARFGNSLLVQTVLIIEKKTKLNFFYWVRRKTDYQLLAKGRTVHVLIRHRKICLSIPNRVNDSIIHFIHEYGWDTINELTQ